MKNGRRHRYYVSNRLISGGPDPSGWRLPAASFERVVADSLADHLKALVKSHRLLETPDAVAALSLEARVDTLTDTLRRIPATAAPLIAEVRVTRTSLHVTCDEGALTDGLGLAAGTLSAGAVAFASPLTLRRRGVETRIVSGTLAPAPDPVLLRTLAAAHSWTRDLHAGTPISGITRKSGHSESFIRTRAQLAFLSPRLQAAILAGTLPPDVTLKRILAKPIPLDWVEQDHLFGLPAA
ncbi:MAG: hypothetical protein P1U75_03655 [Antarcticimicrobium sp.]|uniref:hypothetical protein n=1 Tax=Antarcticimicrobium sp. TaxID=2824147 RepID=UPI002608BBAB|nr:hypothetical protein [Antarcticimicrobium sp.]MDF1715761.1 hypothetical protein [Antarcticimicrobium sp.]